MIHHLIKSDRKWCNTSDSPPDLSYLLHGTHLMMQKYIVIFWSISWWRVAFTSHLSALPLKDSDILSLGVSSHRSWWKDNGPGCEVEGLLATGLKNQRNPELTTVPSCWLEYQYIEILQCIIQLLISVCELIFVEHITHSFISFVLHDASEFSVTSESFNKRIFSKPFFITFLNKVFFTVWFSYMSSVKRPIKYFVFFHH